MKTKSIVSLVLLSVIVFFLWIYQDSIKIKFFELILGFGLTSHIEISNISVSRFQTDNFEEDNTIRIGIIDGEIEIEHEDLSNSKIFQEHFVSNVTNADVIHGTSIAGVIAANKNGSGVVGISSENIEIYNSVVMSNGFASQEDVISGIYYSIDKEVDIINISIEFNIFTEELRQALMDASNKGILIFISNGNGKFRTYLSDSESLDIKNVYLVGSLNAKNKQSKYNLKNRKAHFYYPGEKIFSTSINDTYDIFNGSSYATAIATGHAVNLMKTNNKPKAIKYFEILKRESNL